MTKAKKNMIILSTVTLLITFGVFLTLGSLQADGLEMNGSYYTISTADDLFEFAQIVNGTHPTIAQNKDACARLDADIDLEGREWIPIGNADAKYTGTFDGGDYSITNFRMTVTAGGYWGFFGFCNTAGISNFSISGEVTTALTKNTDIWYGVVARAEGESELVNIHSSVNFTSGDSYYKKYVGGIVGQSGTLSIQRCSFDGTISLGASEVDRVGGILAYAYNGKENKLRDCRFNGTISSTYDQTRVGGILGYYNGENGKNLSIENALSIGTLPQGSQAILGALKNYGSTGVTTNSYYLESLSNTISNANATPVTQAQLKRGEVAYLLSLGDPLTDFGQSLPEQEIPTYDGWKVYADLNCDGTMPDPPTFRNNEGLTFHVGEYDGEGFCANGCYEPPSLLNDRYQIEKAGHLYWFAYQVNNTMNTGISGELVADIVINENVLTAQGELNGDGSQLRVWIPIGTPCNALLNSAFHGRFEGYFNGNGRTVSGIYTNTDKYQQGLFGLNYGTVANVGVINSYIRGGGNVGAIVGYNNSGARVSYCYTENCRVIGGTNAGELVGSNKNATLADSYSANLYNSLDVTNGGTITRCYQIGKEGCDTYKSEAQLASGEVAFLLGKSWGQRIGTDRMPVFKGATVYRNQIGGCNEESYVYEYSNTQKAALSAHAWGDGVTVDGTLTRTCSACQETETLTAWGDANADGLIDLNDAVLLKIYLANVDYGTSLSSTSVSWGADANDDGKIDLADAVLLSLYLANFDYDTGTSTVVLGKQNA